MRRKPYPENARYHPVDTPHGKAALIYTEKPFRLHAVLLPKKPFEIPKAGGKALPKDNAPPKTAQGLAQKITAYFQGKIPRVSADLLDISGLTEFQQEILSQCRLIPFGETKTYGELAAAAGRPKAARAVGQVMAKNPFPIFIPCHRVLAANNKLGGFGGGLPLKQAMLDLEKAKG